MVDSPWKVTRYSDTKEKKEKKRRRRNKRKKERKGETWGWEGEEGRVTWWPLFFSNRARQMTSSNWLLYLLGIHASPLLPQTFLFRFFYALMFPLIFDLGHLLFSSGTSFHLTLFCTACFVFVTSSHQNLRIQETFTWVLFSVFKFGAKFVHFGCNYVSKTTTA